jgi:hypothetical protein
MSKPNHKFKILKNQAQSTPEKLSNFFLMLKLGSKVPSKKGIGQH